MKIELPGKTAVITDSTAGIGFAIVKGLAEAAAVVVNAESSSSTRNRHS